MEDYAVERIDALEAFYTKFESAMTHVPTHQELLPITPPELEDDERAVRVSYGFEPSPEEILNRLLPTYVEAIIFNMLLEASASEHNARRRAMKAATDNAEELIKSPHGPGQPRQAGRDNNRHHRDRRWRRSPGGVLMRPTSENQIASNHDGANNE